MQAFMGLKVKASYQAVITGKNDFVCGNQGKGKRRFWISTGYHPNDG